MNLTEQQAVFAIAATVTASLVYFFILEKMELKARKNKNAGLTSLFIWRKASGLFLLGIIPGIAAWIFLGFDPSSAGFSRGGTGTLWVWIAGISFLLILLNLFNSRKPDIIAMYPELRKQEWGPATILLAAGGWVVYLAGYEYLFRGLLLFSCYEAFGLWPAIAINLGLYSALHLQKGMIEAVAALPFGALICYLTLESGSIIPAIILHCVQAVSCEMLCIYRNPNMKFILKQLQS